MEYQKITNLLDKMIDEIPEFVTKKWVKINGQSGSANDRNKPSKIRFKISMLRSDLFDYSDTYIVAKGTITVTDPDNDAYDKELTLKDNAPFVSSILKINNTLIDNSEDLDIVMPRYTCLNITKTIKKQQVFRIITEMNETVV